MTSAPPVEQSLVPDLCNTEAVLRVLLVGQMLASILVLGESGVTGEAPVLGGRLVTVSLFIHWLSLTSAAVLCPLRPNLARMSLRRAVIVALACLQLVTLCISELAWQAGVWLGLDTAGLPNEHLLFLARTQIISLLVWMMLLRYFYLQQRWRDQIKASAEARLVALQARIRPHFLFNSLNSLAALIPLRPADAERLVENLSLLLRAALDRPDGQHSLADELALTRAYLDIEQTRLGERLRVDWEMQAAALEVSVPVLSLQPLVENAVHHGVECITAGGTVSIQYQVRTDSLQICVTNPLPEGSSPSGLRVAQDNIRSRLKLLYGDRAQLRVRVAHGHYQACLELPL